MTPGAPPRVLVVGDVMCDVVVAVSDRIAVGGDTPAHTVLRSGGAGANVAHWLARLGGDVAFHGSVGDDPLGREACATLERAGVDVHVQVCRDVPTGTCVVIVDAAAERTMLPDQGANAVPREPPDVDGAGHLHMSGYVVHHPATREMAVLTLRTARDRGVTTSLDAASAAPLMAMGGAVFLAATAGTDLLAVTCDEAAALVGTRHPERAAERLLQIYGEVVVKLGRDGALLARRSQPWIRVAAASPPAPVLDTTGAGDAFMAGLLYARTTGEDEEASLRHACTVGALAVTVRGARPPIGMAVEAGSG